ncbi:MAG: CRISPR-associated endonuclease Cas2 [Deltaproteobacteria bacterium]|nr:CRISPR-associated endonuclease Cas2 [Deltaproteobacteria bacterium]
MKTGPRNILVFYDIADPRRLSRVAKLLQDYGNRVQYSVFELHVTMQKLRALHEQANKIIDDTEDSVRYYFLCDPDWQKREFYGQAFSDDDWSKTFVVV